MTPEDYAQYMRTHKFDPEKRPEDRAMQYTLLFSTRDDKWNFGNFFDRHVKPDAPIDMIAAIHWVIAHNLDRVIAYLLHIDSHAAEARSPQGWHPLHRAARAGYENCVLVLLHHGVEVDCTTKSGWTPLMMAAEKGDKKVLQILLGCGASRGVKNDNGDTAWKVARHNGHQLPTLLAIKHVALSEVDSKDEETDENDTLKPPEDNPYCRTPSPGPRDDREEVGKFIRESSPSMFALLMQPKDDIEDPRRNWTGPVKIAILDTGIDLDHPDFNQRAKRRSKVAAEQLPEKTQKERIMGCKNFTDGPEDDVTDDVGHGTHIAGLIMAIAPRAELYIAKVSSVQNSESKEESERMAMEKEVNIVNMSLGFAEESSWQLTEALEKVAEKSIIFAAAANHGDSQAIAWPAHDHFLAICVTSGDDMGKPSNFAPGTNREFPIFVAPGDNILSHWPGGKFRKMSGTSVATPIAVGMAAMILAFLNKTNAWEQEEKEDWISRTKERRIRSTTGMRRVLEQTCRDRNGLKLLSPRFMWEKPVGKIPRAEQILYDLAGWESRGLAG
ncbi:peptidase S8/S53 domain-containing protein [Fusarium acuminatum]|uniref:Peptidase S8/S53 domain-containing protein n=1 Tax=Fusarium acuminatum TaxID=5515 RepID=A0ABZ2X6J7_9HYPO